MSLDDTPASGPSARAGQEAAGPASSLTEQHGAVAPLPLSDARALRALAHPVRVSLLEELVVGGAMTATQLGERIGESPTTCSFHLRQLAKYGFVEEAGGGKGRARPWRVARIGFEIATQPGDPEYELAANAVVSLFRERQLARYQRWLETQASYPSEWRAAAGETQHLYFVTAEELQQIRDDLLAMLLARHSERLADPSTRPPGALPVELLLLTFPLEPPASRPRVQEPPQ
jgi:DNA-binding transcriptional ArsR family regulator